MSGKRARNQLEDDSTDSESEVSFNFSKDSTKRARMGVEDPAVATIMAHFDKKNRRDNDQHQCATKYGESPSQY